MECRPYQNLSVLTQSRLNYVCHAYAIFRTLINFTQFIILHYVFSLVHFAYLLLSVCMLTALSHLFISFVKTVIRTLQSNPFTTTSSFHPFRNHLLTKVYDMVYENRIPSFGVRIRYTLSKSSPLDTRFRPSLNLNLTPRNFKGMSKIHLCKHFDKANTSIYIFLLFAL